MPRSKWVKQQKFISHNPRDWKVQDQDPTGFSFWWGLKSWFADDCLLTGFPPGLSLVHVFGESKRDLFVFYKHSPPIVLGTHPRAFI